MGYSSCINSCGRRLFVVVKTGVLSESNPTEKSFEGAVHVVENRST
jgi:hypothetical protein